MTTVDLASMPSEVARRHHDDAPVHRPRVARRASRDTRDTMRPRIRLAMIVFSLAFLTIIGRLVSLGMMEPVPGNYGVNPNDAIATGRPDIIDRNGEVLAADIKTASVYGEPRNIIDPDEAAELLVTVLPDLKIDALRKRLSGNAGFAWIKREITPKQRQAIHSLGIPGIGFLTENRRFYTAGPTAAHILGLVNVDNQGIAGVEKYVDDQWLADLHAAGFARGEELDPVQLSIDISVQHILHDELAQAMERYSAIAASGIILDAHTGEVMAMASIPDFDPNNPVDANKPDRLNRITAGVYELGSIFKSFTFAMALDSGAVTMNDRIDATNALRVGRFTINDFHGKHRVLTVPEVFIYSSNIGSARMAMKVGQEGQQAYLRKFGFFDIPKTDLPEVAAPMMPKKWSDLTMMTIAFGHGLAVTPLQVAIADAALVNGGKLIPPTFLKRSRAEADKLAVRMVSEETSRHMRDLFALNVEKGSGRKAAVPGYNVGGKTGTAEKAVAGGYSANKRLNSFLAAFPMDDPQYVVLVVLDEPKQAKDGGGATAGWNAAPTVEAVIRRTAALLGVKPRTIQDGVVLVSN
ncbi:peptidoglycan D,D-transpeptidase FtsI family protein [Bauldia litoralis]|uniref:peptidoglycan D,D-transpeptidase FtsI family protein n=1 Tax=Bauldia litoralis TaxID=665467 RepID=UPI003263CC87